MWNAVSPRQLKWVKKLEKIWQVEFLDWASSDVPQFVQYLSGYFFKTRERCENDILSFPHSKQYTCKTYRLLSNFHHCIFIGVARILCDVEASRIGIGRVPKARAREEHERGQSSLVTGVRGVSSEKILKI